MSACQFCHSNENVSSFVVEPKVDEVALCNVCQTAIKNNDFSDTNHWRLLSDSIWSESSAIKVLSYSNLQQLRSESWALDLLDQIYLDEDELAWAKQRVERLADQNTAPTFDSNGTQLFEGDSVTLIKDLDVKGAGFTAKRGTMVKGIRLTNNPEHIDARVNGVQIVLVSKYLKKA